MGTPPSLKCRKTQGLSGHDRQRYNRLVNMGFLKVVAISNPLQRGFKTMALVGIRTDGQ